MQEVFYRSSYDFSGQSPATSVSAFNSIKNVWVKTTLGDVRVYAGYTMFSYADFDDSGLEEQEEESYNIYGLTDIDMIRNELDEMVQWIYKWSVSSSAVKETIDGHQRRILDLLDLVEEDI